MKVIIVQASADFSNVTASGYSFAAFSVGGLVGGLAYGRRTWKAPLRIRYTLATLALKVGALILAFLAASPLMIVAAFCVRLPMTPLIVIAHLLVDERISAARHAEANALLGSGYNLGSAAGAALGGQLIGITGPGITAVALAAATALAAAASYRLPTCTQQTITVDASAERAAAPKT
ncbi:MFS transporter [Streptomyces fuscichromogenes]|uniref:MFS transporter n=1 Tax=Streptomyces fuscichromogenes TaxID=1324013 RepID=UPI001670333F|nr:MFS transporter [Streptomyces fuscichromogenes]